MFFIIIYGGMTLFACLVRRVWCCVVGWGGVLCVLGCPLGVVVGAAGEQPAAVAKASTGTRTEATRQIKGWWSGRGRTARGGGNAPW